MNQPSEALSLGIEIASMQFMRMTEDLKGTDWLHRPCDQANCAAWTAGHLVLVSRNMMKRCGVTDLPALPEGFEQRFARDATAPKASDFGDTSILRPLFKEHHERFATAARSLTPEKLDTSQGTDHPYFRTIGAMLAFAPVHIGEHVGQLSTIRRSLGRPPIT
jgi:hypothetical protein